MVAPVQTVPPAAAPATGASFAPTAYGLVSPATYSAPSAASIVGRIQSIAQAASQAAQARQAQMMAFDQSQTSNESPGHLALGYSGADIARAGSSAYQDSAGDATSMSNSIARNLIAGQQMENEAAAQHNQNAYQQQQNAIQQELVPAHKGQIEASTAYYNAMAPLQVAKAKEVGSQGQAQQAAAYRNRALGNFTNTQRLLISQGLGLKPGASIMWNNPTAANPTAKATSTM